MISEIDLAIASGTLSINKYLDKNRHRARDIEIEHPEFKVYQAVKLQANGSAAIRTDSQIDDESALAIATVFDDVFDDLDW